MTATVAGTEAPCVADIDEPGQPARNVLPELAQLTVVALWASTFILTKDAFEDVSPLAYIFLRFVLITALAFGMLAIRGWRRGWARYWRLDRVDLPRFALAGLAGYTFYQLGFALGLDRTSPFSSSLLISMAPLFSLAIVTLRGERSPLLAWLGVGVSIAGVAIFLSDQAGGGTWVGDGLSLMAAVAFAI